MFARTHKFMYNRILNRRNQPAKGHRTARLVLFALALGVAGCSASLQSTWSDFNAYFNTYYNAVTYFEQGMDEVEQHDPGLNPERPIRVHPEPPRVGQDHFTNAIETSADILRFHPDSRFVDQALYMIGVSYYHMHRFYTAQQHFNELYNTARDPEYRQKAVLWLGRVVMELGHKTEGIMLLSEELNRPETRWNPELRAETHLVLAQLYAMREDWQDAESHLATARDDALNPRYAQRAQFLQAQLLYRAGHTARALQAFSQTAEQTVHEPDVHYYAKRKMAEMARHHGIYQWAYDHLYDMSRSERYVSQQADIAFQIGRTLQLSGEHEEAEAEFTALLRNPHYDPGRVTLAQTYHAMAEIYREHHQDLTTAAAYYDSAASHVDDRERLPAGLDPQLYAEAYGRYAELRHEAAHQDSLLWLASLSPERLDSVVAQVRERKYEQLQREQQEQQDRQARQQHAPTSRNRQQVQEMDQAVDDVDGGFLHHRNPAEQSRMRQSFEAIWAGRPLVDHWRRSEAVRHAAIEPEAAGEEPDEQLEQQLEEFEARQEAVEQDGEQQERQEVALEDIEVDLGDVPFEQQKQVEVRRRIAEAEYSIGNVYFLTLDMPGRALEQYRKVIDRFPESEVAGRARYSLSEVYRELGDMDRAEEEARALVANRPDSRFAERLVERYGLHDLREAQGSPSAGRNEDERQAYHRVMKALGDDHLENARLLKGFVRRIPDSRHAPDVLFAAVHEYIFYERGQSGYAQTFEGANWDSVRVTLDRLERNYPDYNRISHVQTLREEVNEEAPGGVAEPADVGDMGDLAEVVDLFGLEESDAPMEGSNLLQTCEELDRELEPRMSTAQFLEDSGLRKTVDELMLSGDLEFRILVDRQGTPINVQPPPQAARLGLSAELIRAVMQYMIFEPITVDGEPVQARCVFTLSL